MTRSELTKLFGLNRSTIGAVTGELTELGLIRESLSSSPGPGRPSHLVEPDTDNAVVAVDVRVDEVEVALISLGGEIAMRRSKPHDPERPVDEMIELIATMVDEVLHKQWPRRCLGIGVSVPGAITADGFVQYAPNVRWSHVPLVPLLSKRIGQRIVAGNDANLGVVAEHRRGAAVGYEHVAYLSCNVGIGGGFLVGGRPLEGGMGFAGEVGHLPVASEPACRCGGAGCWESKAGEGRLLELAGHHPGAGPAAVAEVIAAAERGEREAVEAVAEVAHWTGVGLRGLINVFDPQIIVLGGSMGQLWDHHAGLIEEGMGHSAFRNARGDVIVRRAALGVDSTLVGAAELAFGAVLDDPQSVAAR